MMTVNETHNMDIIKDIYCHPKLYRWIADETPLNEFQVDKAFRYLLIKKEQNIVGCIAFKDFTTIVAEVHIAILPEFQTTPWVKEGVVLAQNWLKEQGYLRVITKVPAICAHVLRFLDRLDYKVIGMIPNGIIFHKQLMTLFLYEKEV